MAEVNSKNRSEKTSPSYAPENGHETISNSLSTANVFLTPLDFTEGFEVKEGKKKLDQDHPDTPTSIGTTHSITPTKQKTAEDYRKEFTQYEAYFLEPTIDEKEPMDKESSAKTKGTTWTRARVTKYSLSSDVIATKVKKLDAKESVAKKISELGTNQRTRVGDVLQERLIHDRDLQFEWTIAQLEGSYNVDKKGKKSTKSFTVYLKRSPRLDVDCEDLYYRLLTHRQQQSQDERHHRMMQREPPQIPLPTPSGSSCPREPGLNKSTLNG